MKSRGIVNLPVRSLTPHPENPRKDLGDLTEMSESIKKNGVLQNLTVIPKDIDGNDCNCNDAFRYMVIIGHRRLAAAKAAGVDTVPCRIVEGMTHDEQLLTMLEENMQRSDLTPYDQAQGFQLMLDLGQTVEDIEEKSGFSKTTIYHRLNMAKLDKELLKEKQEDDSFQLSISDLIELEKVKDVEKRNEILKKARNSSELKYQANSIAREEERTERMEKIITILEKLGVKKLPDNIKSWNCKTLYTIALEDYGNVEVDIPEDEEIYYEKGYDRVRVLQPTPEDEKGSSSQSTSSKEWERFQKARKDVIEACNRFVESRKDAFIDAALGILKPANEETAARAMWQCIMELGLTVDLDEMTNLWIDINGLEAEDPDEADQAFEDCRTEVFELSFARQEALILGGAYIAPPISVYGAAIAEEMIEKYMMIDKALQNYGFTPSGQDEDLLKKDGHLLSVLRKRKAEYEA